MFRLLMFVWVLSIVFTGIVGAYGVMESLRLPEDTSDWNAPENKPVEVNGVPLRIVDGEKAAGVNFSQKVYIGVGLGNVKTIHFVHSSGGDIRRGDIMASYTVKYKSGKEAQIPLIGGRDTYWAKHISDSNMPTTPDGRHLFLWNNPYPEDEIVFIVFEGIYPTCVTTCSAITCESIEKGEFTRISNDEVVSAIKKEEEKEKERLAKLKAEEIERLKTLIDKKKFKTIPLNFKERNWALADSVPRFKMQLWAVKGIPFISDGSNFSVGFPDIPYRGLMVNLKNVNKLHFLHWGGAPGIDYHIFYSDETEVVAHVNRGNELAWALWYNDKNVPAGSPEGAFVFTWINPNPERPIDRIDVHVPGEGGVQVVGVTAESEGELAETNPDEAEKRFQKFIEKIKAKETEGKVLEWDDIPLSDRPRVLFTKKDIPNLKKKMTQGITGEVYQYTLKQAEAGTEGWCNTWGLYYNTLSYVMTDEIKYAEKSKELLIGGIQKIWKELEGGNPVHHPGRVMPRLCVGYDIIASSGIITSEEDKKIKRDLALLAYKLMDRKYYDYENPDQKGDNFNTDRMTAVGIFALTFPKHPLSKEILEHSLKEFRYQLGVLKDGCWPESFGYHFHVLKILLWYSYALRNNGIDMSSDKRLKEMLKFSMLIQTYPDREWGQFASKEGYTKSPKPSIPVVPLMGDGGNSSAGQYFLYAGAGFYKKEDPGFAGELMWSWDAAGRPVTIEECCWMEWLADESIERKEPELKSIALKDIGFAVLRDSASQSHLGFICGPYLKHHHYDKGNFAIQASGHMISIEPGVLDYSISWKEWYGVAKAHNTVTFSISGVEESQPAHSGKIENFVTGKSMDYVSGRMEESAEVPLWKRHIIFVKPSVYIIWDQIESKVPGQWNYHPLALKVEKKDDNHIEIKGSTSVDTSLVFLNPEVIGSDNITLTDDDNRWTNPEQKVWGRAKWIKVETKPGEGFLVLLHPYQGENKLRTSYKSNGFWEFEVGSEKGEIVLEGRGKGARMTVRFNGESIVCL